MRDQGGVELVGTERAETRGRSEAYQVLLLGKLRIGDNLAVHS